MSLMEFAALAAKYDADLIIVGILSFSCFVASAWFAGTKSNYKDNF